MELVSVTSTTSLSLLQESYDFGSNERLAARSAPWAKHVLRLLIVLARLPHATMRHDDSDVMLCRDVGLICRAIMYTDSENLHLRQSEVIENSHNQLSRKRDLPSSG